MIHSDEIFEQVGNLRGTPLRELGELMFPVEESQADVVSAEEVRAKHNLPEI